MNLLILGSEGFIGRHCVEWFLKEGHQVFGTDLFEQPSNNYQYTKITRLSPQFDELLANQPFDVLINAAGSGNVPYSMSHPVADFEANSLDTIRMLDALRRLQPGCRYIHLSSAAVYGNPARIPVSENDALAPLSAYGWHKVIAEQLCREYTEIYQLRTAVVRPFSVYGPGLKKQLFWDLYQKAKATDGTIELFGTGKESRDYIHVRDLVLGIQCIIEQGELKGEVYNLASGIETSIEEAVHYFIRHLPGAAAIRFNGAVRQGDPLNWRADIQKITALGFRPVHQLRDGLREVAGWIINQPG